MSRIALVGCVKQKLSVPSEARDLYVSALFRHLRKYAEANADDWYVLSAKYGLVPARQIIAPYEQTLLTTSAIDRVSWSKTVADELLRLLPAKSEVLFLAGQRYRKHLEPLLWRNGFQVEVPLHGLAIGKQLQWLKQANERISTSRS